ncbi:MAG: hypothetical protein JXQ83_05885 [Candidatus Glassbacteria bacterium]|nr:hypothetical protein [Candidatus Glassbacteria bacterium]
MRFFKAIGFFTVLCLIAATATAKKNPYEQKGRFGIVIHDNFVTLDYVITYLDETHKPDHLAFRLDIQDAKGLDLAYEVAEEECLLKNARKQTLEGKVERINNTTVILLFPYDENFQKTKKLTLYTVIRDYKLKKDFKF